jgi:putative salt-induced outer membrane protein YdiY/small nuclear ribonucleoprotein (snRNP)-like protein
LRIRDGIWLLAAALLFAQPALAKYDDTLFLKNGDRITGDVKELSKDLLRYKTDAFGTIYVRWDEIQSIETEKSLRIELISGRRVVGTLQRADASNQLVISTRKEDERHEFDNVVAFVRLKLQRGWLERVEGSARFGLNGTKGSETIQWNVGADARYRGEDFELSSRLDSIVTNKKDDTDSERINFVNTYRRLKPDRWFWNLLVSYDRNDELGIDNRYSLGGGYGRYIIRSNSVEFALQGGLVASREFDNISASNQLEGYVTGQLAIFRNSFPKTDINAGITILPSLTESGRLRTNTDISLSREFIEDLALDLSLYYTTDNQAPDEAARDDWGIVTSLEYSF